LFITAIIIAIETGITTSVATVISQLIENIITNTPIIVTADLINMVKFVLSVWLIISTSFVMRDSTSP
jgi:hypothetical protein